MITLYGFGKIFPVVIGETRDLRVQWALEEMGLPYRVHGLDFDAGETKAAAYGRISHFHRVPAIDDDGFVVFETAAILLYLAEKYGKLIPSDFHGRTRVMQWCFAALTTVEWGMMDILLIDKFGMGDAKRRAMMVQEVQRSLGDLERRLSESDWIAGDDFTVADILLACVLREIRRTDLIDPYPKVKNYYARALARPAWQRTLALYAERLGVTVEEIR